MNMPRIAMCTTQTKHTVPIEQGDKLLVSTGADKALPSFLGRDFLFRAKEDGKIIEYDEKSGIMIVEYIDGTKDAYDLTDRLEKNGGGGLTQNLFK